MLDIIIIHNYYHILESTADWSTQHTCQVLSSVFSYIGWKFKNCVVVPRVDVVSPKRQGSVTLKVNTGHSGQNMEAQCI